MPSSKEYLDFILDCLSNIDNITYKSMMGEYLIYYNGKNIAGIYDNRLLLKNVDNLSSIMSNLKSDVENGVKSLFSGNTVCENLT